MPFALQKDSSTSTKVYEGSVESLWCDKDKVSIAKGSDSVEILLKENAIEEWRKERTTLCKDGQTEATENQIPLLQKHGNPRGR